MRYMLDKRKVKNRLSEAECEMYERVKEKLEALFGRSTPSCYGPLDKSTTMVERGLYLFHSYYQAYVREYGMPVNLEEPGIRFERTDKSINEAKSDLTTFLVEHDKGTRMMVKRREAASKAMEEERAAEDSCGAPFHPAPAPALAPDPEQDSWESLFIPPAPAPVPARK